MESDERHQFIDIANKTMIKVTTFVLRLATAFLSMGVVCGADGTGQPQATGSVKLTGSDNGFCQFFGVKNGCDANYVLQSTLYDDGSVVGKVTDVGKVPGNEAILVQADVDCMKFFFIGGNKYAVVGGVYITGDKLVDILELDAPFVGRRFITVAKEDVDGVVFYSGNAITNNLTCDDVTEDDVEIRFNYYETVDGQAIIVFPSDPVNCGYFDSKKECRKSKDCEWDTDKGTCVSSLGGSGRLSVESLSKDEAATLQDMANSSNSADHKVWMLVSGMVAGLFFALWL